MRVIGLLVLLSIHLADWIWMAWTMDDRTLFEIGRFCEWNLESLVCGRLERSVGDLNEGFVHRLMFDESDIDLLLLLLIWVGCILMVVDLLLLP